ncbi:hypothetical protein L218DRAFT_956915, partial [Marasmius fiardii PR-910]
MSIRTVQTKLRASPSFNVLTAIDTNSPPGLAHRAQDIDLYFEKPSQPSYSSSSTGYLAPSPVIHSASFNRRSAPSTSTLSPYASPYKPRSAPRSTSQFQIQNQYHQQTQRAGTRAGRGAPVLSSYASQGFDSELPGVNYSQTSSSASLGGLNSGGSLLMDPLFNGVPTYSLSSRFDPFGDYSASEKTLIPSSKNRTSFSPLTPTPANSMALTQAPGAGTGREPAYTHYYYYDKSTNSPTLAYGSRQSNNRINLNQPRNQWNHKARGNNNPSHYNNRRPNNSFTPSRSPSPPSVLPAPPQVSFTYLPNTTPSRSPSPPSPNKASFMDAPIAFPKTDASVEIADSLPAPVRTRKRSNAFREVPKAARPTMPSSSPPLPEFKPKPIEKKQDSSMASKLVAAMLLNRVDASGRSRCAGSATKRLGLGGGYVKSGLSRVVWV